jgi:hypothetical protein
VLLWTASGISCAPAWTQHPLLRGPLRQCQQRSPEACFEVARGLERDSVDSAGYRDRTEYYLQACELGHAEACRHTHAGPESRARLVRACDSGSGGACLELALAEGTPPCAKEWRDKALAAHEKRCAAGDAEACGEAGAVHLRGLDAAVERSRAVALFERACELGQGFACQISAKIVREIGGAEERDRELRLHRRACLAPAGAPRATPCCRLLIRGSSGAASTTRAPGESCRGSCFGLESQGTRDRWQELPVRWEIESPPFPQEQCFRGGEMCRTGDGVARDDGCAREMFAQGCALGHGDSCTGLGAMIRDGREVSQDPVVAHVLFLSACRRGSRRGCAAAGRQLHDGEGVARDLRQAAELWEKSCAAEAPEGCYPAGVMYHSGQGVERDVRAAFRLFGIACEARASARACLEHGMALARGEGVGRSLSRAYGDFQKACEMGEQLGCAHQGLVLWYGRDGVLQDWVRGRSLLEGACRAGITAACEALKRL